MSKSTFTYVTFIRTTPDRLWQALTTAPFIEQYWFGMRCESDWQPGASWKLLFKDGRVADSGEIVEADAPRRLVIRWTNDWNADMKTEGASICAFDIETVADNSSPAVKLSITHQIDRPNSKFIEAVSGGWPKILSNLKSLLETGEVALKSSKP